MESGTKVPAENSSMEEVKLEAAPSAEEHEETEEQQAAREAERKANHEMDCGKILERGIGHLRDSEFPPRPLSTIVVAHRVSPSPPPHTHSRCP